MHLTDDQLLEPTVIERRHLDNCQTCQQRTQTMARFRDRMADLPTEDIQSDLFLRILKSNEANRNKQKLKFWRKSSYALAASVAFVSLFSVYQWQIHQPNHDISSIIALNNEMQKSLSESSPSLMVSSGWKSEKLLLEQKIKEIDREIQAAYLNDRSEKEIKNLWQKRLLLLGQLQKSIEKNGSVVRI